MNCSSFPMSTVWVMTRSSSPVDRSLHSPFRGEPRYRSRGDCFETCNARNSISHPRVHATSRRRLDRGGVGHGHAKGLTPDEYGPGTGSKVQAGGDVVVLGAGVASEVVETRAVLAARLIRARNDVDVV